MDGDNIKDFYGKIILQYHDNKLRHFAGHDEYKVEGNDIKDIYGKILYKIEGSISRVELMFVLTLLFEENY